MAIVRGRRPDGGGGFLRPLALAAPLALLLACSSLTPAPRAGTSPAPGSQAGVAVPAPTGTGSGVLGDSGTPDISPADVSAEVTRVFGDSIAPMPMTEKNTPPEGPVWDIDVHSYETRARVVYFVNVFSTKVRSAFAKSLERQTRYGPLLRQKLREGGLPEDMIYLALIESWYDPNAYSSAAAVGMWQFMARTARGAGLRVDWWVDERRDPVRSTEAAVRYLKSLREKFGSMYLAAAAYNGGDGRVSRGLTQYADDVDGVDGDDRFFALSDTKALRQQTRDYVPKLIAAALVGKEPARYGVPVESLPPFAFDTVEVPASTPLSAIASASGSTVEALRDLNPHLIRGMTPLNATTWVRVPPAASVDFAERFAALEPDERVAVKRVESKKGESMKSVAKKHNLSLRQLSWYNPKVAKLKSGNLRAGQVILVPSRATYLAAANVPDPSIERYPRRARVTKASAAKAKAAKAAQAAKSKAAKTAKSAKTKAAAKGKRPA